MQSKNKKLSRIVETVSLTGVQVAMLLWCWVVALITDPGRVPGGWHPFQDEEVGFSVGLYYTSESLTFRVA